MKSDVVAAAIDPLPKTLPMLEQRFVRDFGDIRRPRWTSSALGGQSDQSRGGLCKLGKHTVHFA
jgi:hypothetical protein